MAEKSLTIMAKMIDLNLIDYYIFDYAISSKIAIKHRYQINFCNPVLYTLYIGLGAGLTDY